MKNKRNWTFIITIVIVIIMIYSSSIITDRAYFVLSFSEVLTLIFAIIFTYFLVEKDSQQRQRREYGERLIIKIQTQLSEECLIHPVDSETMYILMKIRSIQTKIGVLYSKMDTLGLQEQEVSYVKKNFDKYEELYGEVFEDPNKLKEAEPEFIKIITLTIDKLEIICGKLY